MCLSQKGPLFGPPASRTRNTPTRVPEWAALAAFRGVIPSHCPSPGPCPEPFASEVPSGTERPSKSSTCLVCLFNGPIFELNLLVCFAKCALVGSTFSSDPLSQRQVWTVGMTAASVRPLCLCMLQWPILVMLGKLCDIPQAHFTQED